MQAFIRVIDDSTDGPQPYRPKSEDELPIDRIAWRIQHLTDWGIRNITLVADDVFQHRDWKELVRQVDENNDLLELRLITNGTWVEPSDRDTQMVLYQRDVDLIVPMDWWNPFEPGDVLGYHNYVEDMQGDGEVPLRVLQQVEGSEIWQTPIEANGESVQQWVNSPVRWVGHQLPTGELVEQLNPPEDLISKVQEASQEPHAPIEWRSFDHWGFASAEHSGNYSAHLDAALDRTAADYVGTIYVDGGGYIRTHASVDDTPFGVVEHEDRDVLREVARVWRG